MNTEKYKNLIETLPKESEELWFEYNLEVNKILQENQDLKEEVDYLRRSIERKEETIIDLEHKRVPYENKYVKELKTIREKRRSIKNDMERLTKFKEHKTKLVSTIDNRQLMLSEMNKREKQLNCPYKNRRYTEEEMQKILKGV